MDKIKKYTWNTIYILGTIGMLDMAGQAFTYGELKIIRSIVAIIFE